MKIIYIFYFLFLLPIFLVAQEDEKNEKTIAIYGIATIQMPEFSNFNTILQANNYSTLPALKTNLGGGIMFRRGDISTQLELRSYKNDITNKISNGTLNVSLFQLNIGYSFLSTDKFKITPMLGAGVARGNLSIFPISNPNNTLGGLLTAPTGFAQLNTTQFSLHLGLQADAFPIYFNITGGKKVRTLVALKTGYYLPFQEVTWRTGNTSMFGTGGNPVSDKINMNFGGFYVSLIAGIEFLRIR
ncbi:MAG: hypothetical protein EAZ85_02265 [Bacteroidetes bacterium]|nr:MAG: hypothetical protein EAZ85_02265 [Bacteroidota bacterium]TAG90647.1 MAG: hypothetical protein EAZ20_03920 [Bacteroidota bacterium]